MSHTLDIAETRLEYCRRYQRERRAKLRVRGACLSCGGPRPCKPCGARSMERVRALREQWRAEGMCTRCGGEREDHHRICEMCREDGR